MTRILGIADLHIGAQHLTSLDDQERALELVREVITRERVDLVLVGGDLFHQNRPTPAALAVAGRFFNGLLAPAVMARGNHDPDAAEIADYFRSQVWTPRTPELIQHPTGVDIAIFPYLPDSFVRARAGGAATKEQIAHLLTTAAAEIIEGFLAQRRPGIPLVFVGHGTVAGSETSTGYSMGWNPGTAWLLQRELLARFDASIVGHIHRGADLGNRILIPGSLLPLDFSEAERKGGWIIEVDVRAPAFIRRVEIETPRVETIDLGGRGAVEAFLSYTPALPNARVRIRVSCDEPTAREYPPARIAQEAYAAGATLVQVELNVDRSDRRRDSEMTDELLPVAAIARYLDGVDALDPKMRERIESLAGVTQAYVENVAQHAGGDLALVRLEATDFIGIREAAIDLEATGIYAITGPVGAGKSSMGSDVARFALFGESRAGAKERDRLIRTGADVATAAATLRSVDGHTYRVVRKLKRGARGASSALDVLEKNGADWRPLSDGKVANGQAVIDRILGGLSDETLVTANLVLQRESDRYTRAPREDRRRVLAEAAGLAIYDALTEVARETLRGFEKELGQLQAAAAPLAARAREIPGAERELAELREQAEVLEKSTAIADAHAAVSAARLEHERAQDHYRLLDAARDRLRSLARDLDLTLGDIVAVDGKIARTRTGVLDRRQELEESASQLVTVRARIIELELQQVADEEQSRAAAAATIEIYGLESKLDRLRGERKARLATLDAELASIDRQERRLADAQCPVIDQIRSKKLEACTFLGEAQLEVRGRAPLEAEVRRLTDGTLEEHALVAQINTFPVPDAPDTRATAQAIATARLQAKALETNASWAAKIPEAEAFIAEETRHLRELQERAPTKRAEIETAKAEQERIRAQAPDGDSGTRLEATEAKVRELEQEVLTTARAIARLEGRIEELRTAAAEAERLGLLITDSSFDVAAAKELVTAWRACRVMVLETSVIPAVEQTANEILRRFPYGLQLRFATQRDRKSGDGQAEALDIEVLGGVGPIYEMCSGGQQTVLDFALHVAIALVVSRRAGSRLSYLYIDEPAFLDAPGYEAFAAAVRWIHETFHMSVLVASHVRDLVDALGAREFVVEPGAEGSTVREEAFA